MMKMGKSPDPAHFLARARRAGRMATLLDRPAEVGQTIAIDPARAAAVADPVRSRALALMCGRAMTAEQVADGLARRGSRRALTTVRHHIEVLRSAGLVDVVRVTESRGGVTKHYGTAVRLLPQAVPADFGERHSGEIEAAAREVAPIVERIAARVAPKEGKRRVDPAYRRLVVAEILNRAMTAAMERTGRGGAHGRPAVGAGGAGGAAQGARAP